MLRPTALTAAALLLAFSGSAQACTCLPPPPLSECVVDSGEAALLVTLNCVKSLACDINTGQAVADATIDKVFEDNTNLGLQFGDMVTIRSGLQPSVCGIGPSFVPGDQWIMFLRPTPVTAPPIPVFSDGTICDVTASNLTTMLCDGNIQEPTDAEIMQLMDGCATRPVVVGPPVVGSVVPIAIAIP